jgi:hypothetical protein
MTLTRPPSVRTVRCVRKSAIGVGRKNHAVAETAVPQFRPAEIASISAVRRLATAPPCRPANGPAAKAEGRQWLGVPSRSKIATEIPFNWRMAVPPNRLHVGGSYTDEKY